MKRRKGSYGHDKRVAIVHWVLCQKDQNKTHCVLPSPQIQNQKGFPWGRKVHSMWAGFALHEGVCLSALMLSCHPLLWIQFIHCSHLQTQLQLNCLFRPLLILETAPEIPLQTLFLWFYKYRRANVLLVVTFQFCPFERVQLTWKTYAKCGHVSPHCIMRTEPDQKELKSYISCHVKIFLLTPSFNIFCFFISFS